MTLVLFDLKAHCLIELVERFSIDPLGFMKNLDTLRKFCEQLFFLIGFAQEQALQ